MLVTSLLLALLLQRWNTLLIIFATLTIGLFMPLLGLIAAYSAFSTAVKKFLHVQEKERELVLNTETYNDYLLSKGLGPSLQRQDGT